MAKFMDVHSGFVGVTEDQLREAHECDLAIEASEGVHFERAWLDPESGKVFCLSSGPSKEAVHRVHDKAGHPGRDLRGAVEIVCPLTWRIGVHQLRLWRRENHDGYRR